MKRWSSTLSDGVTPSFPASLTDLLGPEKDRYFASGYRDVRYQLNEPSRFRAGPLSASYEVQYPSDWSIGANGDARTAHLSTIDGAVIALNALDGLGVERTSWIQSLTLRAGSFPWERLSDVPVELCAKVTEKAGNDQPVQIVSGSVGNIAVACRLARASTTPVESKGRVVARLSRAHVPLMSTSRSISELVSFHEDTKTLQSTHSSSVPRHVQPVAGLDIESLCWPRLAAVDLLATMGQLAQSVILLANKTDRDGLGTLWMRSLKLTFEHQPCVLPTAWRVKTQLVRDREITRGSVGLRDVAVSCRASTGAAIEAKLAYTANGELQQ